MYICMVTYLIPYSGKFSYGVNICVFCISIFYQSKILWPHNMHKVNVGSFARDLLTHRPVSISPSITTEGIEKSQIDHHACCAIGYYDSYCIGKLHRHGLAALAYHYESKTCENLFCRVFTRYTKTFTNGIFPTQHCRL